MSLIIEEIARRREQLPESWQELVNGLFADRWIRPFIRSKAKQRENFRQLRARQFCSHLLDDVVGEVQTELVAYSIRNAGKWFVTVPRGPNWKG